MQMQAKVHLLKFLGLAQIRLFKTPREKSFIRQRPRSAHAHLFKASCHLIWNWYEMDALLMLKQLACCLTQNIIWTCSTTWKWWKLSVSVSTKGSKKYLNCPILLTELFISQCSRNFCAICSLRADGTGSRHLLILIKCSLLYNYKKIFWWGCIIYFLHTGREESLTYPVGNNIPVFVTGKNAFDG